MDAPVRKCLLFRWLLACADSPDGRLALLLGATYVLLVGNNASFGSFSTDTARYALVGREMVERGDWTRLTVDGEPYANKPPLPFWLEAAAFSVLGFNEAAARLPSRAFGFAVVLLLVAMVRRRHGRRAAFWAGLIVITWVEFQHNAQTCRVDSALLFFTLASLGAFFRMARLGFSPRRAILLGFLLGLGILSKGPAGAAAALAILLGASLSGWMRLILRCAPWVLGTALLVAGPWYGLQLLREGEIWAQMLESDMFPPGEKRRSIGYILALYGRRFFLPSLIWVPGIALGIRTAVRRLRRNPRRALEEAVLLSLIAIFLAILVLPTKHYARHLLPLLPALAWLGGAQLAAMIRSRALYRAMSLTMLAGLLVVFPVLHAAGLPKARDKYADVRTLAAIVKSERPDARELASWPPTIGKAWREGFRFYFGMSLKTFEPSSPPQVPFVLVHGKEAILEFERSHTLPLVTKTKTHALYRTLPP